MKKSKFTEAQIVFSIKQSEQGVKVEEICRKMGSVKQPFTTGRKNTADWVSLNYANSTS